jgi:hypothetical protein
MPERDSLFASLASTLGTVDAAGEGGAYSTSTAFGSSIRRRLLGSWTVAEHKVGEEDYLAYFMRSSLKGMALEEAAYTASFVFKETVCLKKVEVSGKFPSDGTSYAYRMRMAMDWKVDLRGVMTVCPELGYQYAEAGGEPAAVRDFRAAEPIKVSFSFEGDDLLLSEGDDRKRLRRSE